MSTDHQRVINAICAQPWAITEEGLQQVIAIAQGHGDPQAVAMRRSEPLKDTRRAVVRDGVATIPVTGPVFRYANLFTEISGATSLETLATDLQSALSNPSVRAILLNMDTPGGQATGVAEFSQAIRAASRQKPVWAYVGDVAASAGYWMAAGASRIVGSRTSLVGSIGVVVGARITKDAGQIEIVSSQSPNKRPDLTTDAGKGEIQRIVDALASVFIGDVARFRGVSEETVQSKYGSGGIVFANQALQLGMIDAVGSYEGVLAELASGKTSARSAPGASSWQQDMEAALGMPMSTAMANLEASRTAGNAPVAGSSWGGVIQKITGEQPASHGAAKSWDEIQASLPKRM